ncbi:MAG: redoxin domain-containing protein [Armatimonadetes bacterium]|nr:redoxin domain-containing protein [Armatimonadota bacterium]
MMKTAVLISVLALATASMADGLKVGQTFPSFSLKGSDGKTHNLAELSKKGPVFFYFVKQICSANPFAIKYFEDMYKAYGKKVTFVGVINSDAEGQREWAKEFGGTFMTLLDKDESLIHGVNITHSQWTFEVAPDGKVVGVFPGFGINALKPLSAELARVGKVANAKLAFLDAPGRTQFG